MTKLKDGACTGDVAHGNPYKGDIERGIAYDMYEANFPTIAQEGNFPAIRSVYRKGARALVEHVSSCLGETVLDIGSGTGIATLELLTQQKGSFVVGIEVSEGMLQVARYKFHHNQGEEALAQVKDKKLLTYWESFREESAPYKLHSWFINADIQKKGITAPRLIDAAIANQVMHWTNLPRTFENINRLLRNGAEFVWNSASHFYNDSQFPASRFGFRYNDFLAYVLDDVCSQGGLSADDHHTLSKPSHDFESIRAITQEQGFETSHVATHLYKVDLQVFVQNHVPAFVKQLVTSDVKEEEEKELEVLISKAIGKAIVNPKALADTEHKYDIVPIFKSVKV